MTEGSQLKIQACNMSLNKKHFDETFPISF